MKMRILSATILFVLAMIAPDAIVVAETLAPHVNALLKKYCYDCHDADSAKAKLLFATLPVEFENAAWVRVHDRLQSGQMPPPDMPQPTVEERTQAVAWLARNLKQAAGDRQNREGRVPLRRMNRREYESTLHDLLGIAEPLASMLPEESVVHGFDTISVGLSTSATHMLRFQETADRALRAALPIAPPAPMITRWTGRQYLEGRLPVHRSGIDPFTRLDGDALVLHCRVYGDMSMQAPRPPLPGRYRVRASLRLVNSDKAMPVLIGKRVDRFQTEKLLHVIDYVDVRPNETKIVEIETDLGYSQQNQFVFFEGLSLPFFRDFEKQRGEASKLPLEKDFAGPGLAIDWAEIEGPLDGTLGYERLFGDLPKLPRMPPGKPLPEKWQAWNPGEFISKPLVAQSSEPKSDAERLLRRFLPLAFRRPVAEELANHYVKIAHDKIEAGEPFDDAMRATYKSVLCSAHFLNYVEAPGRLDDYAVAARLARFLWNSLPDRELFLAAKQGTLTQPAQLRTQTERMLKDPKAARFAASFTDQWLDLAKFLEMKPDGIYAEYDDLLAWSMPMETRKFFDEVLAHDLPTSTFFHSDWTYLNERLATHYGISGVTGMELRKVALRPEYHRGGVLTHGSILKLTTNASYTSPVKRGAWVMERLIGKPPPPPPPDVKAIEPDIRGATTIREQLALHKNVAVCAACHVRIDPPGLALENFDVVGGWRERYRVKQGGGQGLEYVELTNYPGKKVWIAKRVEADGETAEGQKFQNVDEYKRLLLADQDQFTRNLAEKLILYATGAELDFADRAVVEEIVRNVREQQHGFRSLIHAVIQSPIFLKK